MFVTYVLGITYRSHNVLNGSDLDGFLTANESIWAVPGTLVD